MTTWPRDNYVGPRGGQYPGPQGGLSTGRGGGMSTGPGGGLYTGPCDEPYRSNWPPAQQLFNRLRTSGLGHVVDLLRNAGWK